MAVFTAVDQMAENFNRTKLYFLLCYSSLPCGTILQTEGTQWQKGFVEYTLPKIGLAQPFESNTSELHD